MSCCEGGCSCTCEILRKVRQIDQAQKEVQITSGCITCENSLKSCPAPVKNTVPVTFYMECGSAFEAFMGATTDCTTRLFRIEEVTDCTCVCRLLKKEGSEIVCTSQTCIVCLSCVCCLQCFEGICCEPCNICGH